MIKLQAEFKAECRKLAAECQAKGLNFKPHVTGLPKTVHGLATAVNELRRILIRHEAGQQLKQLAIDEREASEIIKNNRTDW